MGVTSTIFGAGLILGNGLAWPRSPSENREPRGTGADPNPETHARHNSPDPTSPPVNPVDAASPPHSLAFSGLGSGAQRRYCLRHCGFKRTPERRVYRRYRSGHGAPWSLGIGRADVRATPVRFFLLSRMRPPHDFSKRGRHSIPGHEDRLSRFVSIRRFLGPLPPSNWACRMAVPGVSCSLAPSPASFSAR